MKTHHLIGGVVYALVLFIGGFLFYGMSGILDSYNTPQGEAVMKGDDEMSLGMIFLGNLVVGLIMALVYGKWARGVHNFGHGAQFGVLLGLAYGLGMALIMMATSNFMTGTGHIIDAIYFVVINGIAAGIMSLIFAKMEN